MSVNLSAFAGAGWQFFNDNGDPLTGGKLYTYAAGTTTPAVTYTSQDGGTAHSNPIILDAAGRVADEIWLTIDQTYKFQLKDANDVLIGTYDNIYGTVGADIPGTVNVENFTGNGTQTTFILSAPPGGVNNTQVFINGVYQFKNTYAVSGSYIIFTQAPPPAASKIEVLRFSTFSVGTLNADQVIYDPAGTGAVATTVQAKLRETVSVKDFGAVGNGVTDDTAAIQAAIDTGKAINGVAGETYLIKPLTQSTANQYFDFRGCTLTRINSSPLGAMLTLNGNRAYVIGGYWDGNKANQSGSSGDKYAHAAITIVGDYCTVTQIESYNSWGIGIKGAECSYASILNNRCIDSNLFGVYVESTSADAYGNEILNNLISSSSITAAGGVYLTGNNTFTYNQYRWKISGNTCVGSTSSPTGIGITTRAIYGVISENITVGYTMGVSADSATRTVISNNNISDTSGASDYGIELNAGYNTVTGNVIRNSLYGVIISGTISAQNHNTITGNLIENASRSIFIKAGSNPANYTQITGNTFSHTGASTGQVGVYLQGDCKYSHIASNLIQGPGNGVGNGNAVFLDGCAGFVSVEANRISDWDIALGLYSGSALSITNVTFNNNDCTKGMPSPINFIVVTGSATLGARIVQLWNNSANGCDYNLFDVQNKRLIQYSGAFSTPEANVTAAIGSLFINLNGGAGTTFYVKQTGAGNTGWSGK